jgi:hypothetical protein
MPEDSRRAWLIIVLTVLIVAAIVVGIGFQVAGMSIPSAEERAEERDHFARYCHTVYGEDADVYRANDAYSAEHNGLHCDGKQGTIHRTQIPSDVWEEYKAGDVNASYVTERLEEPPGIVPWPFEGWESVVVPFVLIASVVAVRAYASHREDGGQ